jgi:hypothetical protein
LYNTIGGRVESGEPSHRAFRRTRADQFSLLALAAIKTDLLRLGIGDDKGRHGRRKNSAMTTPTRRAPMEDFDPEDEILKAIEARIERLEATREITSALGNRVRRRWLPEAKATLRCNPSRRLTVCNMPTRGGRAEA